MGSCHSSCQCASLISATLSKVDCRCLTSVNVAQLPILRLLQPARSGLRTWSLVIQSQELLCLAAPCTRLMPNSPGFGYLGLARTLCASPRGALFGLLSMMAADATAQYMLLCHKLQIAVLIASELVSLVQQLLVSVIVSKSLPVVLSLRPFWQGYAPDDHQNPQ